MVSCWISLAKPEVVSGESSWEWYDISYGHIPSRSKGISQSGNSFSRAKVGRLSLLATTSTTTTTTISPRAPPWALRLSSSAHLNSLFDCLSSFALVQGSILCVISRR